MNFPACQLTGEVSLIDRIIRYFAATPNCGFSASNGECTLLHLSVRRQIKNLPTGGFKINKMSAVGMNAKL